jgi:hypothetical protein
VQGGFLNLEGYPVYSETRVHREDWAGLATAAETTAGGWTKIDKDNELDFGEEKQLAVEYLSDYKKSKVGAAGKEGVAGKIEITGVADDVCTGQTDPY